MKTILKTAAIAALLGTTAFGVAQAADIAVTFDPGNVAYGYSDGYWTNKHEWRTWEKPEYVQTYRTSPGDRKSTRLNSSHRSLSRMPSSA